MLTRAELIVTAEHRNLWSCMLKPSNELRSQAKNQISLTFFTGPNHPPKKWAWAGTFKAAVPHNAWNAYYGPCLREYTTVHSLLINVLARGGTSYQKDGGQKSSGVLWRFTRRRCADRHSYRTPRLAESCDWIQVRLTLPARAELTGRQSARICSGVETSVWCWL